MNRIELCTREDKAILSWLARFHLPPKVDEAVMKGEAMGVFPNIDWMELAVPHCFAQRLQDPWFDAISEVDRDRLLSIEERDCGYGPENEIWLTVYRWILDDERDCYFEGRGGKCDQGVVAARGPLTCKTASKLERYHHLLITRTDSVPGTGAWVMMCDATSAITVIAAPRDRLRLLARDLGGPWALLRKAYRGHVAEWVAEWATGDPRDVRHRHTDLGTLAAQWRELEEPLITSREAPVDAEDRTVSG